MASVQGVKYIFFVILLFLIVATVFTVITNAAFFLQYLILIVAILVVLFVLWKYDFIITMKDYERSVIFRFGKINRVGGPGWALILPGIETHKRLTLRTQTLDVKKQDVITKDSIELQVDAVIYLRVRKDPQSVINSILEVEDYQNAVRLYVISMIRDIMGSMVLADIISNIESLNKRIREATEKISINWGIAIDAVEIKDVDIPAVVIDAMHRQKAAVQEKLARIEKAEAHKIEISAVKDAAESLSDRALSYYYIKALEEMSRGKGTKIFFPIELSKLAESLSGKMGGSPEEKSEAVTKLLEPYKDIIAGFVDSAVKDSKKKTPAKKDGKKPGKTK